MAKQFFKLLGGTHFEDGKLYRRGEVVESNRPLDTNFENKFQKVGGPVSESPRAKEIRARKASKSAAPVKTAKGGKKGPQKGAEAGQGAGKDPGANPFGKDVTGEYEQAQNFGLQVFRKRDLHTVIDPADPKTPLNEKGIPSDAVNDFVENYFDE